MVCKQCGQEYELTQLAINKRLKRGSSADYCKRCASVIRRGQTNMERYGVENAFQSKELQEKSKRTMLERYGVEHPAQNKDILEKQKKTNLERYGHEFVAQNKDVYDKVIQTNLKKYGTENPQQNKEIQEKTFQTNLERHGMKHPITGPKSRETMLERYGVEYNAQSSKLAKNRYHQYTASNGFKCDSKYELDVAEYLIKNNIEFCPGPSLDYKVNKKEHVTHIDFEVNYNGRIYLFEVKGGHLLKGVYDKNSDHKYGVPIKEKLKVYKKHHIIMITDITGLEYLEKHTKKLTCIDIEKFRGNINLNELLV
jgi:hypothetical protein